MSVAIDVCVIGAGPAGSAAAAVLAGSGARVVLADRATFPRAKVCGDGVLPDAQRALAELGVLPAVRQIAAASPWLTMRTANGRSMRFAVESLVTGRRELDALLVERAAGCGASLLGASALEGVEDDGRTGVVVRLVGPGGSATRVRAGAVLLATGAARRARLSAGLTEGAAPAAALRGYATGVGLPGDELLIALLGELRRGYAWAFPGPGGVWNVGCGVFAGDGGAPSLAKVADGFLASAGGRWLARPQGAPLLTSFPALAVARGAVAAIGDAAGLTRPFSGEGIGPALESGILAARCLLAAPGRRGVTAYARALRARFGAEFRAWRFGELFLRYPVVVDAIVRRVERLPGAQRRCAAVLAGTLPAGRLLSPVGLIRLVVGR